ncbi:MAG TPA: recombinase family protein [Solirubrobacteraceae bacterium]|jgi:DNA invertase Pin-like site-specific DNA recombinase|nr:recombinase family protein [Solirubrobacteraceae bacterium]
MATTLEREDKGENGEGAPAVVYVRVSPGKGQAAKADEPDGYSLPAQLSACKRKATGLKAVVIQEFIERSESAKTADRPELQRMLEFVKANRVRYVIVHKVDRLARNRTDDVLINMALKQAGAELVSVSENIDQTPSGLLLHGIMSSIAEFYSRNLATEVIKGCVQKAKSGGTPGKAPLGYLNVRTVVNGLEGRTVEVDPERGPLMAWAFQAYATGEWTIRTLLAELNAKGLTTVPGPKTPSTPLTVSHLHRLLRHPYYVGIVRYQGVLYQGKHEQLVDHDTWQRVQELLTAKHLTGEKHREHPHYLKGSIFCGQCGSRLIVCHAKGRGGIYPYFICLGRQQKRTECELRALKIEKVEAEIARFYATVQLKEDEHGAVRAFLEEELTNLRLDGERERKVQERRLVGLMGERKKLLDAHYADAVPLDLLKSEQERLTRAIDTAESRLAEVEDDFRKAESNLQRALTRAGDCHAAYQQAAGPLRRQFNLAFFRRLLIDDDYSVTGVLAEPFDTLLGPELRRAAVVRASEGLQDAIATELRQRDAEATENEERPREPAEPLLVGAASATAFSYGGGFSTEHLVRSSGLEPPRAVKPTRPSTGFGGCRWVRGHPDRPFWAAFWTYRTHLARWMFSKCSHVPAPEDRTAASAGSPSKPLRFCSDGIAGGIR